MPWWGWLIVFGAFLLGLFLMAVCVQGKVEDLEREIARLRSLGYYRNIE